MLCSGSDDASSAQTTGRALPSEGSCATRGVGAAACCNGGVQQQCPPPWIPHCLATTFFGPCEAHRHLKKNEVRWGGRGCRHPRAVQPGLSAQQRRCGALHAALPSALRGCKAIPCSTEAARAGGGPACASRASPSPWCNPAPPILGAATGVKPNPAARRCPCAPRDAHQLGLSVHRCFPARYFGAAKIQRPAVPLTCTPCFLAPALALPPVRLQFQARAAQRYPEIARAQPTTCS